MMKPHVTEIRMRFRVAPDTETARTGPELLAASLRVMADVSGEPESSVYAVTAMDMWHGAGNDINGTMTVRRVLTATTPGAHGLADLTPRSLYTGPDKFVSVVERITLNAPRQTGPSGEWRPHALPTIAAAGLRALAALDRMDPAVCEVALVQELTPHIETVEVSHASPGDGVRLDDILAWEQSEVNAWRS